MFFLSRRFLLFFSGFLLLSISATAALLLGSTGIGFSELLLFLHGSADENIGEIFFNIRLPRIIMAANTGAVLAIGGLCFQNVLRNPLAEPYILGVSGGAAVGGIIGILLGFNLTGRFLGSFCGGLGVLFLVFKAAGSRRTATSLLLSGVMVNAFCGALIMFLIAIAKPYDMGTIMFWFMGNLGNATLSESLYYTLALAPGLLFLCCSGHTLNLILLGRDASLSLGTAADKMMCIFLVLTSLMVCALVALTGPLGFVGLVVPQCLRLAVGPDNRILAPASALYGAVFVIICDIFARVIPQNGELPIGVISALIGAPIFILLYRKQEAR